MLEEYNFHWREGYKSGYEIKRDIYTKVEKSAQKRRITVITGTRRVGKTTLMRQIIDSLTEKGISRHNILYFSFDEEQPEIRRIIKDYESRIGKEIAFSDEKYFIFLDEIQKLKGWHEQIKYFYDFYKNIKLFISGSASLFIREGVRESLAGRIREFYLGPLRFREYLKFRGKGEMADKPEMFRTSLETEFERYIIRQYIEIVDENEEEVRDYVRSIIEKVIFIDIPYIFRVENPHLLMKIVSIIASNPGMLVEYSSLSRSIGNGETISRVRASRYIHYLEESYLLKLGYNYSRSAVVSERKLKKAYLSNPSLSMISTIAPDQGKLVEQSFFLNMNAQFFWRTPQKDEVDMVIETPDRPLPVEVKYQNTIVKKDAKPLIKFMKKHGATKGIIITKNHGGTMEGEYGTITQIEAWRMALQEGVTRDE